LRSNSSHTRSPESLATRRHRLATDSYSSDAPATSLKPMIHVSHAATNSQQNLSETLP